MLTVLYFWYRIVFIYLKGTDSEIFALDKKLSLDSGCDRKCFRVLNNKCTNCLSLSTPSTPSPPPPASPFTFVPNSLHANKRFRAVSEQRTRNQSLEERCSRSIFRVAKNQTSVFLCSETTLQYRLHKYLPPPLLFCR